MQAVATAPRAAEAIGIAPVPARTLAFVIAAAAGGLGGGLQAGLVGFIAPSSFPFSSSILLLLVVVVGGAGWTLGPLLGAVVVAAVPELLSGLAEYRLLVFGALLLVVLWVAPGGIAGALARVRPGARGAAAAGGVLGAGPGGAGLAAAGVRLAFGGVPALQGVGLTAPAGVVTSVIGPNGAGKTTFLNVLSGFQAAEGGTVRVGGAVLPRSAWRVARAGVARTFQTAQLFPGLSVVDNVRLGLLRGRWRGAADAGVAAGLLGAVGYCGSFGTLAGSLAHVDRRLVELARALATGPSVLLLDEPAAGLDAGDTARLGPVLRAAAAGRAVVLVEHDMGLVMSVSDRVVVLDAGRVIAEGRPAEVRADPAVIAAYLGARAVKPRTARPAGTTALEVSGLEAGYGGVGVLSGVSLRVGEGGVLAVLGPNGAGKSTLMQALAGLVRPGAGSVVLGAVDVAGWPAHRVARAGLVLVPEGRQVFPALSVRQNLVLGAGARGCSEADIDGVLARFPKLRPLLGRAAGLLSGGEQQMLAIGRGLLARPRVLLLDEPSLGLAPAVADAVWAELAGLAAEGMTLVVVDQMADQVLGLADQGVVLGRGRVVRQGEAAALLGLGEVYLGGG